MRPLPRVLPFWLPVLAFLVGAGAGPAPAAEPPRLRELRTQQVGTTTYFHVGFEAPANLAVPRWESSWVWRLSVLGKLGRLPQLVPQDNQAQAVYTRLEIPMLELGARPAEVAPNLLPAAGLEFVGKSTGKGQAKFLLLYPAEAPVAEKLPAATDPGRRHDLVEVHVTLDFDEATKVPAAAGDVRKPAQPPGRNDLEGLWASGQAARFAVLEALAPECSFYGYARAGTGRAYGVPAPPLRDSSWLPGNFRPEHQQLYETTTGAAAIGESLQMERLLTQNFRDKGVRRIDVTKVPGIDIAEHPWRQMMGDHQPAPEPLARLVPYDNYYIQFKNSRKFIELGELLDQWGTSLLRAYEVHSRDYRLKQRYERQLCLRSTVLGKTLGPLVIRGLAVTGSDGYLREGSDVTLLFHVVNRPLFLAAVDTFIQEARQEWGARLKEGKNDYHGVTIETFATPLREVSLHRAQVGEFVIYSNSPAAVRRVLDTQQGRYKALAESLDFQYMRTVFRADGPGDGFAFLSDPFIRRLVGPASKIKEKRRLEALTSLTMVTNDALFTAWETGKLPASAKGGYASAVLKPEEVYTPEGRGVTWDGDRHLAVADAYGTLLFATPLIELPVDLITEEEERQYRQFRGEYLGLWRRYFDPVGLRFALDDKQVRVETYILPLLQNSEYNELRARTGNGTIPLEVNGFPPQTIVQMVSHLSPTAPERESLKELLRSLDPHGDHKGLNWLGDWFLVRFDDSAVYGKMARQRVQWELDSPSVDVLVDLIIQLFQVPVTVGVGIKNPLVFAGVLTGLRGAVHNMTSGTVTWAPLGPAYKGVSIVRIQATRDSWIGAFLNQHRKEPFLPAVYYALVDGGFYVSVREDCIKAVIDRAAARKEGKLPRPETVPVNTSLYLAPEAGAKARDAAKYYLEWQTHRQALDNVPFWYALYRAGLVPANAFEDVRRQTALRSFGFVPVSAEGAPYDYEPKTDEVVNRRHGSLRRPQFHPTLAEHSPLGQLLEQFRTLRADLRFREDGVNTVLTIERQHK